MSGKKFKACHLGKLNPVVSDKEAAAYREQMGRLNLRFRTQENSHLFPDPVDGDGEMRSLCEGGTEAGNPTDG